jgi:hypothetical protein
MNPSRLSWKIISGLSDRIFNANHLIFTGYGISTLTVSSPRSLLEADKRIVVVLPGGRERGSKLASGQAKEHAGKQ